ncbi:hypothetical protein GKR41_00767 [Candidatus Vallotia lariciata]|nr:hypothetical protein GKR41_00767 [Candidatus Vallotia lariciata]
MPKFSTAYSIIPLQLKVVCSLAGWSLIIKSFSVFKVSLAKAIFLCQAPNMSYYLVGCMNTRQSSKMETLCDIENEKAT